MSGPSIDAGRGAWPRVAVIGAGLAGLTCARQLADAGAAVVVFDKSRGVGGRMAARRLAAPGDPPAWAALADHGCPGFEARQPAFAQVAAAAAARGWLLPWQPRPGRGLPPLVVDAPHWVATPSMKGWCTALARGLTVRLEQQVEELGREPGGWAVLSRGGALERGFDRVVLALPPAQAAVLLRPHHGPWADRLLDWPMQPTWTWLGVSAGSLPGADWDVLRPVTGPLARIDRQSGRAWRPAPVGHEVWTAHASVAWSEAHLEATPAEVEPVLRAAVEQAFGGVPRWAGSWVHRWRYAQPADHPPEAGGEPCWWSPELGLGVAGDALGTAASPGVGGVEAAWTSGQALAARLLQHLPPPA